LRPPYAIAREGFSVCERNSSSSAENAAVSNLCVCLHFLFSRRKQVGEVAVGAEGPVTS
jgi:hypothetical protein